MNDNDDNGPDDLLRQIQQRRREAARSPLHDELAGILNDLNAVGSLEALQEREYAQMLCYGPKTLRGDGWMGVVIWCRRRGYYAYKTLTLLGIWAVDQGGDVDVIIGSKTLIFNADYYSPEAHFRHLQTGFEVHYSGGGDPPPEHRQTYRAVYDPLRRLAMRREIETELAKWAAMQ